MSDTEIAIIGIAVFAMLILFADILFNSYKTTKYKKLKITPSFLCENTGNDGTFIIVGANSVRYSVVIYHGMIMESSQHSQMDNAFNHVSSNVGYVNGWFNIVVKTVGLNAQGFLNSSINNIMIVAIYKKVD